MLRAWLHRQLFLLLFLMVPALAPAAAPRHLRIAIDRAYAPYEFVDEQGQVRGFTPDLVREIARQLGWQVEFRAMDWPQALAALESGTVDLANMIRTPARAEKYAFSLPHSTIDQSLFCNRKHRVLTSLDQLRGRTIAFQKGDIALERLADRNDFTRHLVVSKEEGFLLVMSGHVDGFFAATQPGIALVEDGALTDIVPGMTGLFPLELCFAARKDREALIQKMNQALLGLQRDGRHAALVGQWLSASLARPGWQKRSAPYLLAGLGLLLATVAVMFFWSRSLQRQVDRRTRELEETLGVLEQAREEALVQQHRTSALLDMGGFLVVAFDAGGRMTFANREFRNLLRPAEAAPTGAWLEGLLSTVDATALSRMLLRAGENAAEPLLTSLRDDCGRELRISWQGRTLPKGPDGQTWYLALGQDLTAQLLVEETLRDQQVGMKVLEAQFQATLNAVADPVLVLDRDRTVIWCNQAAEKRSASLATMGGNCHQYYFGSQDSCDECLVQRCIDRNEPLAGHLVHAGERIMEVSAYPVHNEHGDVVRVVELAKDVSERVKMQNERYSAGQLAAIGELATGIAHEINNPINGIINYAQILKGLCLKQPQPSSLAGRILTEAERIAHIVANLLDFTRKERGKVGPVSLHELVTDTLILVGAKVRNEGVELRVRVAVDLPPVEAVSRELQQVLINLVNNARYAVHQRYRGEPGGRIEVVATSSSARVALAVKDNGTGIPPDLMDQVRDAFFTTKPEGEGTGLGLSICGDILQQIGGSMAIDSVEGEWTRVTLQLPRSDRRQEGEGQVVTLAAL